MKPHEHYLAAEALLEEGVEVVKKISEMADRRRDPDYNHESIHRLLTATMDEYGKKAMGIWAQAQVHATLATS